MPKGSYHWNNEISSYLFGKVLWRKMAQKTKLGAGGQKSSRKFPILQQVSRGGQHVVPIQQVSTKPYRPRRQQMITNVAKALPPWIPWKLDPLRDRKTNSSSSNSVEGAVGSIPGPMGWALRWEIFCSAQRFFRSKSRAAHQDPTTPETLKSPWQGHPYQAPIKISAKYQGLKTAWQGHSFQALVKRTAKC